MHEISGGDQQSVKNTWHRIAMCQGGLGGVLYTQTRTVHGRKEIKQKKEREKIREKKKKKRKKKKKGKKERKGKDRKKRKEKRRGVPFLLVFITLARRVHI